MTEISTPKNDLAQELALYNWRERHQIIRAAKHLRKFISLTSREMTPEEEVDNTIEELEKEK